MFDKEDNWDEFPGLKERNLTWTTLIEGNDRLELYTEVAGSRWHVRMNNFPDEPLYTLIINGDDTLHFNDWPSAWVK